MLSAQPESTQRDINQLIFDYAEYRRDRDECEIYQRLSSWNLYCIVASSNFEPAISGQQIAIDAGMDLQLRSVTNGSFDLLLCFVDRNDPRLGDRYVMMTLPDIFDAIEKMNGLHGVLIYNNKESFFGILKENFNWVRSEFFSQIPEQLIVPPGHKVVVIKPIETPYMTTLESGARIVDFGRYCKLSEFFTEIEQFCEHPEKLSIIWIVQPDFISYLQSIGSIGLFLQKFDRILSAHPQSRNVVLPHEAFTLAPFRDSLLKMGAYIFSSAPDGACFVEVHQPDGSIHVGMHGKPFA
jgi:hypothetical protein